MLPARSLREDEMNGLVLLALSVVAAEPDARDVLRQKFESEVSGIAARVDGVVGVTIVDLESGGRVEVNGDVVFAQASAIKLPLLVELLRQVEAGKLRLEDEVVLEEKDLTPGSGVLSQLTAGKVKMTLRDVATLMITVSDNSATNMIIDRVSMASVNETMDRFGLHRTRLQRKMQDDEAWMADRENLSTPNEQARLLELLHRGEILASAGTEEALRILAIPKSSRIRALLPPGTRVAHKTGSVPGVVVDVGIVYLAGRPFVVSAMANWLQDESDAEAAIAEISLAAYRYFDRLQNSNSFGHKK
jgi:beta-lactamase class A